jgi:predicted acyltransferase
VLGLLATYWVLLVAVPLPGGAAPSLQPGRNLPQSVDVLLLGSHSQDTHTLLSVISVTATVLIGALASRSLRVDHRVTGRAILMAVWGALLVALGLFLSHWMPLNRRLWTPSFCLFTAGIAMMGFAAFYWVIDGRGTRRGFGLLIAYGANPILLFVLSEAVRMAGEMGLRDGAGTWRSLWMMAFEWLTPTLWGPKVASLIFALAYTLMFGLLAEFMYRRNWIVKI